MQNPNHTKTSPISPQPSQPRQSPGVQCDSLDLYIKTARRINISDKKGLQQAFNLASFFTGIINGEVPDQFKQFLRQTYLVALEKDPDDKTKLRPGLASNQCYFGLERIQLSLCSTHLTLQLCHSNRRWV